MSLYFDVGEHVEIVEGRYEGDSGVIVDEHKTNFGKQYLDVEVLRSSFDGHMTVSKAEIVRVRASDARRP